MRHNRSQQFITGAAFVLIVAASTARATDYVVATNGNDASSGTSTTQPFRTIQRGIDAASPGDAVRVRSGDYREQLVVLHSGTSNATLVIEGFSNEAPTIIGSEPVTNWVLYTNAIWKTTNWVPSAQQVFVDGQPLRQNGWPNDLIRVAGYIYFPTRYGLADLTNGTFFCDLSNRVLYVWLADSSAPTAHTVDVSIRPLLLFVGMTNQFTNVRGIRFRHTASVGMFNTGLPAVRLGANSTLSDCVVEWGDAAGISLSERCETLRSDISHNGFVGLGWGSCTNCRVASCTIFSNNYREFNEAWHAGGIKVIPSINDHGGGVAGGIVESNDIAWNYGYGVWFDSCTGRTPIIVRNNFIHHNGASPGHDYVSPAGILMEVVKGATIENNVVMSNRGSGIWIAASDNVKVRHNTLIGDSGYNDVRIADIPRPLSEAFGIWASLVSNEVVNNVILNSDCQFTIAAPFDDNSPTNFVQGNVVDYNCYFHTSGVYRFAVVANTSWATFTEWTNGTPWDKHSVNVNPLLDPSHQPQSGSPVIDTGTSTPVSRDFNAIPRPLDGDNNGAALPDMGAFEAVHPTADTDHDHLSDLNELAAGTDPLNALSFLAFSDCAPTASDAVLRWTSVTNRRYTLSKSTNLLTGFSIVATNLAAFPPSNSYTDASMSQAINFYRVEAAP